MLNKHWWLKNWISLGYYFLGEIELSEVANGVIFTLQSHFFLFFYS